MNKCECKECLHYECCCDWTSKEALKRAEEANCECDHYKPKSLFVELPCAVGDKVYYIGGVNGDVVNEATVVKIYIGECELEFLVERNLIYWEDSETKFFYTKEEAEKKLKEMG